MIQELKKLIDTGTIICGKIVRENGMVRFNRVDPSQIESIPEKERAYASSSMGRAIFTIDKDGKIHNFKGVDSKIVVSELGPVELVNAKTIVFDQGEGKYSVSAMVFNDKEPEIRIKGTSYLKNIEKEAYVRQRLAEMGIKVPQIGYIKEFTQEFCEKSGLPIKIQEMNKNKDSSEIKKEDDELER